MASNAGSRRLQRAHYGWMRQACLNSHPDAAARAGHPQVVAWSAADDLLSWYVPSLPGVTSTNLKARNSSFHIPWLFASPAAVHDNYAKNKHVVRFILQPSHP